MTKMCFPRCYEHREILVNNFGEILDNEDPWSLHNVIMYNIDNNIPWPDTNVLAYIVHMPDEDVYIYQNEYAMYFSHLFFDTPLYIVSFLTFNALKIELVVKHKHNIFQ